MHPGHRLGQPGRAAQAEHPGNAGFGGAAHRRAGLRWLRSGDRAGHLRWLGMHHLRRSRSGRDAVLPGDRRGPRAGRADRLRGGRQSTRVVGGRQLRHGHHRGRPARPSHPVHRRSRGGHPHQLRPGRPGDRGAGRAAEQRGRAAADHLHLRRRRPVADRRPRRGGAGHGDLQRRR